MFPSFGTSAPLSSLTPSPPTLPSGQGIGSSRATPANRAALAHQTGVNFEAFFVSSMLDSMTAGMKADKMFGGGTGENMFHSLLNQQYGAAIAARGTLGIADMVQKEILRLQEHAS